MAYEKELEVALAVAFRASERIMNIYRQEFDVNYKKDDSPVTKADVEASQIIQDSVRKAFPEDGYMSEEIVDDGSRMSSKRFWVVDPLDGTKEFVKQNGEFTVNIALVDGTTPVLGVIYAPTIDAIYYAVKGQGAFLKSGDRILRLNVSERINPIRVLVSRSHPSPRTFELIETMKSRIECIDKLGSSLKGCYIAEGKYDVYYNFGLSMKWDTCAIECIIREAGGIMKRLDGKDIDYNESNRVNHGFYIVNREENTIKLN